LPLGDRGLASASTGLPGTLGSGGSLACTRLEEERMDRAQRGSAKAIWSWALYDFANSPFTTLVVTFIYAYFFTQVIASDEVRGTTLWSRGVTITALSVALLSPFMGAIADRGGYRKALLVLFSILCVGGTLVLYWVLPGQAMLALLFFVLANIAFELALVFYDAFLPDVAPAGKIGRVSGYGWGLGYIGGLLALVVALFALIQPDVPLFGFGKDQGENVRATNLLVAAWYVVFSVPILLWVKEDKSRASGGGLGRILNDSVAQLVGTFSEIRKYRHVLRFLLARLVYNDALVTVFAFGGIYAGGTFDFSLNEVMVFGIVLNLTAGLGAFLMGHLDDRLGGRRTIEISLWGLTVASLLAVLAPNKLLFWIAGIVVGIFAGPNQSASRSLMGRFVPPDKENEFFGFFHFSGKATAFLGPFLLGTLTGVFDNQRAGVSIVVVLFAIGHLLLRRVDERAGIEAAQREVAAS
jgi:UMF1 family MFS transporter